MKTEELHPEGEKATARAPSFPEIGKDFPHDLIDGTKRIFSRDNVPLALVGTGLTGLALAVDGRAEKFFRDDHPLKRHIVDIGNTLGQGYIHVGVGASLLAAGEFFGDNKLAITGVTALEALLVNGIATQALKYAVGRRRPNGRTTASFPSGHTSSTAALAASISEMYDWKPAVAIPLAAATAFVGISRIDSNMHYLSDVIAGATLGTVVGKSFAAYHKGKSGEPRVAVMPFFEDSYAGLLFCCKY